MSNESKRNIISQSEKLIIWNRYFPNKTKGICSCCEFEEINILNFSIGHKTPFSKGGTNDIENLIPLCHKCNSNIRNKYTIEEHKIVYIKI